MIMEEWMIYVIFGVEIINLCLLLGLLYVFRGLYKKVRSKFTLGLICFASAFLLKSIVIIITTFLHIFFPELHMYDGPPVMFLVNIIECIGLSIFLKIIWE